MGKMISHKYFYIC